MFSIIYLTT